MVRIERAMRISMGGIWRREKRLHHQIERPEGGRRYSSSSGLVVKKGRSTSGSSRMFLMMSHTSVQKSSRGLGSCSTVGAPKWSLKVAVSLGSYLDVTYRERKAILWRRYRRLPMIANIDTHM